MCLIAYEPLPLRIWDLNRLTIYGYCLGFRTTAALFDQRTSICWLGAIDPFEGPLKLLLFKKPVYNCYVDSNCFILWLKNSFHSHFHYMFEKKNQAIWTIPFLLISILLSTIADVKNKTYWSHQSTVWYCAKDWWTVDHMIFGPPISKVKLVHIL